MFGYVLLNRKDATKDEVKKYRMYYCGLCQSLSQEYGKKGEKRLSFDMTFLYLLLSDLYNEDGKESHVKCTIHPIKGRDVLINPIGKYCADMQVLLSYSMAEDNISDEKSHKDIEFKKHFSKEIKTIEEKYPVQFITAEDNVKKQIELEKSRCSDILTLSIPSSNILGAIFSPYEDCWSEKLKALGMAIGRFIYILDAFDDLKKDEKRGTFNPLESIKDESDFKNKVRSLLEWAASDAAVILEKLPLDENLSILRNIIYSGIWTRFEVKANKL